VKKKKGLCETIEADSARNKGKAARKKAGATMERSLRERTSDAGQEWRKKETLSAQMSGEGNTSRAGLVFRQNKRARAKKNKPRQKRNGPAKGARVFLAGSLGKEQEKGNSEVNTMRQPRVIFQRYRRGSGQKCNRNALRVQTEGSHESKKWEKEKGERPLEILH